MPGHAQDVLRRLEGNLFPEIGLRPIGEITAPTLLAAVRKIETEAPTTWRTGFYRWRRKCSGTASRPAVASAIPPPICAGR